MACISIIVHFACALKQPNKTSSPDLLLECLFAGESMQAGCPKEVAAPPADCQTLPETWQVYMVGKLVLSQHVHSASPRETSVNNSYHFMLKLKSLLEFCSSVTPVHMY